MRKPNIYTHQNSHFAEGSYKRLEINVSEDDQLESIVAIDRIIEEHFPQVPREKIQFGFHSRTEGRAGSPRNYLMLVLQVLV